MMDSVFFIEGSPLTIKIEKKSDFLNFLFTVFFYFNLDVLPIEGQLCANFLCVHTESRSTKCV